MYVCGERIDDDLLIQAPICLITLLNQQKKHGGSLGME